MDRNTRIFVAGARDMVGSAIARRLTRDGYRNLLTPGRDRLDLRVQRDVEKWFDRERPEVVFLSATRMAAAADPDEVMRANLAIHGGVLHAAWKAGVRKLCFLGPSGTDGAPAPVEWYGQAYRHQCGFDAICALPAGLYGPRDAFHPAAPGIVPRLIRRFHDAKVRGDAEVALWGIAAARAHVLHVDDFADAAVFLTESYSGEEIVGVGPAHDVGIPELVALIVAALGYEGRIFYDAGRRHAPPSLKLDVSRIHSMGWTPRVSLRDGIESTYRWFLQNDALGAGLPPPAAEGPTSSPEPAPLE